MQDFRQKYRRRSGRPSWLDSSAHVAAASVVALLNLTRVSLADPSSLAPTSPASVPGEKLDCIDKLVSLVGSGDILLDREAIAKLARQELGRGQENDYLLSHPHDDTDVKIDTAFWSIGTADGWIYGGIGTGGSAVRVKPCKSDATYAEKTRQFRAKFPHTEDHGALYVGVRVLKDSTYSEDFLLSHKGHVCTIVTIGNSAMAHISDSVEIYGVPNPSVDAAARANVPISAFTFSRRECNVRDFRLSPNLSKVPLRPH